MEAVKEGRLIIVRVPLEGGGRIHVPEHHARVRALQLEHGRFEQLVEQGPCTGGPAGHLLDPRVRVELHAVGVRERRVHARSADAVAAVVLIR